MRIITYTQRTPEWAQARCGNATASRIPDVMAKGRGKNAESLTRKTYMAQIVAEILSGKPCEQTFSSKFTVAGSEQEPFGRAAYEVLRDISVDQVGYVAHESIARYGASPDGLIGKDGMIEIKSPKPSTHLEYLLSGVPPEEYQPQMLGGMDVCERAWCDFISYCDIFPSPLDLFIVRFFRDNMRIAEIQDAVIQFNGEVDLMIAQLAKIGTVVNVA